MNWEEIITIQRAPSLRRVFLVVKEMMALLNTLLILPTTYFPFSLDQFCLSVVLFYKCYNIFKFSFVILLTSSLIHLVGRIIGKVSNFQWIFFKKIIFWKNLGIWKSCFWFASAYVCTYVNTYNGIYVCEHFAQNKFGQSWTPNF